MDNMKKYDDSLMESIFADSNLRSMNDYLPLKLFNSKLFKGAMSKNDWNMIIFLIHSISLNILLRSKSSNRKERLIICHISLFTSLTLYAIIMKDRSQKNSSEIGKYNACLYIHEQLFFFNDNCNENNKKCISIW